MVKVFSLCFVLNSITQNRDTHRILEQEYCWEKEEDGEEIIDRGSVTVAPQCTFSHKYFCSPRRKQYRIAVVGIIVSEIVFPFRSEITLLEIFRGFEQHSTEIGLLKCKTGLGEIKLISPIWNRRRKMAIMETFPLTKPANQDAQEITCRRLLVKQEKSTEHTTIKILSLPKLIAHTCTHR